MRARSGFPNRTPIEQLYAALRDLGYEDGRTADIELLGAEGNADRLNSLVADLIRKRPQVIVALTSPAALALNRANIDAPVVFLFVSDPIRLGLVESLPRPGGNYTGVTFRRRGAWGEASRTAQGCAARQSARSRSFGAHSSRRMPRWLKHPKCCSWAWDYAELS